jgi:hypothetical protein
MAYDETSAVPGSWSPGILEASENLVSCLVEAVDGWAWQRRGHIGAVSLPVLPGDGLPAGVQPLEVVRVIGQRSRLPDMNGEHPLHVVHQRFCAELCPPGVVEPQNL